MTPISAFLVPDIHPGIADVYRRKVERLVETLEDPDTRAAAALAMLRRRRYLVLEIHRFRRALN